MRASGGQVRALALCGLTAMLLAGCGAHRAVSPDLRSKAQASKKANYSAWVSACFPGWEQTDMRIAQNTKLPVPTQELMGSEYGPRLVLGNIAVWLGDPADTPLQAKALLGGFVVRGLDAAGPQGTIHAQRDPSGSGGQIYIQEMGLTPSQQRLLAGAGLPVPKGPVTIEVPLPQFPQGAGVTVKDALQALLTEPGQTPRGGTLYSLQTPEPQPTQYISYLGPVQPAEQLTPPTIGEPACTAGPGWFLGQAGGLLEPMPVFMAMHSNGVTYGFAPGQFMVDSDHAGYDQIYWYREPSITVPSP